MILGKADASYPIFGQMNFIFTMNLLASVSFYIIINSSKWSLSFGISADTLRGHLRSLPILFYLIRSPNLLLAMNYVFSFYSSVSFTLFPFLLLISSIFPEHLSLGHAHFMLFCWGNETFSTPTLNKFFICSVI
jgi:hypothetical protein